MRPEELRGVIREQPFRPFRVFVSDGSAYDVRHPELIFVTRRRVLIALPTANGDDIADDFVRCDPVHITRIEPIRDTSPHS